jgi:hypothetical protein
MPSGGQERFLNQTSASRHEGDRRPERKPLLNENDLRNMISTNLQELSAELQAGKSERLLQYLEFASRFHKYSRANQMLIYLQRPDATLVASYKQWQAEGYHVARGEQGIRILAPSFRKQVNEETGEEERKIAGFVAVSVFDKSQLTPENKPPEFFVPLEGDHEAFCKRIVQAATADGFVVEEALHTRGAEGYSTSGRRIVTRRGLASGNRAMTLIHEYAHGLLHQGEHELAEDRPLTREQKELHAEATAFIVGRRFNLPTTLSSDYLLHWQATPERLGAELNAICKAASHIISKLHDFEPGQGQSHDPEPETEGL